jgi:hypothetical protein
MSKRQIEPCPGSDHWASGENVLGKGRCPECGELITRTASGLLCAHVRIRQQPK